MSTDVLFATIAYIAKCLLPVCGVVLLIYIIFFVKELINTMKVVAKTIETTEGQIKKLDAPLATAEDISHTIDEVHHSAKDAAKKATVSIKDGVAATKNWVNEKVGKSESTAEEIVEVEE